jgi:hypothetical protein
MKTPTINPDEMLKSMAAEAVKQHKQIRTTIRDLTLEALQMRELSLKQINSVVRKVTEGVNVGVGDGKIDVEKPSLTRSRGWMMPCSRSSKPTRSRCRN